MFKTTHRWWLSNHLENSENIEHRVAKRTTSIGEYHESQTLNYRYGDVNKTIRAIDLCIVIRILDLEVIITTNTP